MGAVQNRALQILNSSEMATKGFSASLLVGLAGVFLVVAPGLLSQAKATNDILGPSFKSNYGCTEQTEARISAKCMLRQIWTMSCLGLSWLLSAICGLDGSKLSQSL